MENALVDRVCWIAPRDGAAPVRGIVLRFAGLGGTAGLRWEPDALEEAWSRDGALVVFPYYSPWAWMNPATVAFVDELIDALVTRFRLARDTPVIATGGSMGGHAALTYALQSGHEITRCLALSPVCDLPYHYGERPDLPRTLHCAYGGYGDITQALEGSSPVHQAARMPDIEYLVIHGAQDEAVAKVPHSDKFVARMRAEGRRVEYLERAEMGHCGPLDAGLETAMFDFVRLGLAASA